MSLYAQGTSVPMERSRAEIERDLTRYGASHFGYMATPDGAELVFHVKDVRVRLVVKYPKAADCSRTPTGRHRRGNAALEARDAEIRRLWRSASLVIKAKLEAVNSGISTFDREFLADIITDSGRTIGEIILPRLSDAVHGGRLLPASTEGA